MVNIDARNIFGLAITVAYARSTSHSLEIASRMCEAISQGFGMSTTDGSAIYSYFTTEAHPNESSTFFTTPYTTYESEVYDTLASYLPTASAYELQILTIAAHALLFAYTVNPSINLTELQKLIGDVLLEVSGQVIENQFFSTVNKLVVTPFSSSQVTKSFLQNDYTQVIVLMRAETRNIESPLTNYNWYDASSLFKGPDLQIMKDVENQYYYVSGLMIFESAFGSVDPCIEDVSTISTWSGDATFTYYRQVPCREASSYIGPPSTLSFNRIFNDGPSSSGYFTTGLSGFYVQNDKAVLDIKSYTTNTHNLFTYTGTALCDDVATDANGEYSFVNGDYLNAPFAFGCTTPYQRLHIGDNRKRYICDPISCVCTLSSVTGFKFVSLSLLDDESTYDFQFRQTNPLSDESRILRRALNVADNPYWATDVGGVLYPYTQDNFAPYTQYWTIGHPVLNGTNILPELAFFQTFDSPTFGDSPSLVIFPSLGTAYGSAGENEESDRTFSIGSKYIFSGAGSLPLSFNEKVSSNLSGFDRVTQQFFGMGTAFSGKYAINVHQEENAGFLYSGFNVSSGGQTINSNTLADLFLPSTVGRKYSEIKYISGYKRISDGALFGLTNSFAKDSSGNLYTYGYIAQADVPMVSLAEDNWSYFAPTPSALEDTSIYERVYSEQTPENYLPRFYDGPFSKETRKFLYPNARAIDRQYAGKTNGVPNKIRFKIKIREEAVKEVFAKYTIYADGLVTTQPEIVRAIRSDVLGERTLNPKMRNIFIPDSPAEQIDYNFNFWDESDVFSTTAPLHGLVDINWAPSFFVHDDTFIPSGKNTDVYTAEPVSYNIFSLGLKSVTNSYQQHIQLGKSNSFNIHYSPQKVLCGLFHDFQCVTLSGALTYALPTFDLETNTISVNNGILEAFPDTINYEGLQYTDYNGLTSGFMTGRDPLFLERIGGRRGGDTASAEGGYHSKELVGDRWLGMVYETFGTQDTTCTEGGYTSKYTHRYPKNDAKLALFNTDASGTDIWINGMSFAPYKLTRNTDPITATMSFPFSKDNLVGTLLTTQSGEFVTFNLGQYFPLKNRVAAPGVGQWYYTSGLKIGPFDRDIEIGLTDGEEIVAYSEFFINGQRLSHWFYDGSNCERDWIQEISIGRTIKPGAPAYANPRRYGYTILSVIPSGKQAEINIYSDISYGEIGDPALDYIGMPTSAIVTLKTHVPLDANGFDELLYSGERGRLESKGYVNNNIAHKYRINHSSFESMAGIWEFTNYGYSGKLYKTPNAAAFTGLASADIYGNLVYSTGTNVETYWRSYAIKNATNVVFSGYREGSRISFEIYDVQVDFDIPPYQSYDLVIPSGTCSLSGAMGYYAQADNSIFTEGIYLTNQTVNDDFAETYDPSYVSPVLSRIPSGYFRFPSTYSGSGHAPVLEAPSVMKQREDISGIAEGQNYSYLFRFPVYNYNKLLWPALSDLETLNAGETLESIPPGDGDTFSNSTMMFSACQGQNLPNGEANPIIVKKYGVRNIFQLYDSVATDALINSGYCITSGRGLSVTLSQDASLSGALVPRGTPLSFITHGLA